MIMDALMIQNSRRAAISALPKSIQLPPVLTGKLGEKKKKKEEEEKEKQ